MFDSQVSLFIRSQGLEKKKKEYSRIYISLVAAQCNGIAACTYSLKIFTVCTYITVHIVPECTAYCTWSVVLKPLLSFVLINGPQRTLFEVNCWNDLFSLPFEKRARILCLVCAVVCACRFVFRFGSIDIVGGYASLTTVMILLIDIVVVQFDAFVCTLTFETNNVILSPKYNIFIIGSIVLAGFWMFRGLSVNPTYLWASCHVCKIGCLLVRGISLPAT